MTQAAVSKYRPVIGLEVHIQLDTRTKMFCGCAVEFEARPNSRVCPVCLGYPGTLPVINGRAVELAVLTGLALRCRIAAQTRWDRKSYFYPDMPKNYQISQYALPLAANGRFDMLVNGQPKSVRIRRAHLEEDAGKNIHDPSGGTLVDLNRAGTPLLEIVTEPDLASAEEVYVFCVELQRLVTYLGVSEGNMKKGQMRFEPNVNVVIAGEGEEVRTPISEIKNLNSFRHVREAVAYEIQRQVSAWEQDGEYRLGVRPNENRGYNAEGGVTEFQRGKETAPDYRYFPDPDLVPVELTEEMLAGIRARLPELPIARRQRLVAQIGLSPQDAETIVAHRPTADLFEAAVAAGGPAMVMAKQFVNVWLAIAKDRRVPVTDLRVPAAHIAELAAITADGTVSSTAANQLAAALCERIDDESQVDRAGGHTAVLLREGAASRGAPLRSLHGVKSKKPAAQVTKPPMSSPRQVAAELGLIQVRDAAAAETWVDQAFRENEKAVRDALAHPKKAKAAAGFLRGQVMRISAGRADPKLVGELIEKRLERLRAPDGSAT